MAVTGTISQNQLTLQGVIDRAFSRAGVPMQVITSEYIETARQLLDLTLSEFVTTGVSLWTNGVSHMGMRAGLPTVTMPDGTLEIDRVVVLTTTTTAATLTGSSPTWLAEAASAVEAEFVGVKVSTAGFYDIAIDSSPDGVTYTEVATFDNAQLFTGQWNWFEVTPATASVAYFRVRETTPKTFPVTAIQLAVGGAERPLTAVGQDAYANFPGKRQKGSVTSYYTDRRVDGPVLYLWNAPNDDHEDYILFVWRKRHMIDVGSMTARVEVPQRWMDAIIWDLAWRLCSEIPEAKKSTAEILALAERARAKIAPSESDGGMISMVPDIGMYTS